MQRLLGEIMEQPATLQRLLEREGPRVQELATTLRKREIELVLIAARGSSDNAATYGKYLLGALNRLPVALAAPSLYTLYQSPPRLRNALVLGISQSGRSPDIVAVLEDARRQGMMTVAITNEPGSPLGLTAEQVIACHAGEERSVAATKTYTAQLLALAMLAVAWAGDEARWTALRPIPDAVAATLAFQGNLAPHVERYRYMTDCAVVGRGYNYATACEIALKLKELTYSGANPYSSADFMHGPIAVVQAGFPALLIAVGGAPVAAAAATAQAGDVLAQLQQLGQDLVQRGAELIVISDRGEALALAQTRLLLPIPVEEWLSPIVAVLPGQLFAYHLALARHLNPEQPRGLRKVTETR